MKRRARLHVRLGWACALFLFAAGEGLATPILTSPILINGDPSAPNMGVPYTLDGVLADGYSSANAAYHSSFRNNILVLSSDETWVYSQPLTFSSVPYTAIGNVLYFAFLYDLKETKHDERIVLSTSFQISGDSEPLWTSTDHIELNPVGQVPTLKPQGNGADMALLVPVSLFEGKGLTGASTFVFGSRQVDGQGGPDEWIFSDEGLANGTRRFDANDPISSGGQVPEPATVVLLFSGAGLIALARKIRGR